jgi:hypothetical protein
MQENNTPHEPALPFSSFHLTLSRRGGVADVDQTLELRWDGDAGKVSQAQRGQHQSGPANRDRVLALWRRLEAVGFWEQKQSWKRLLGWLSPSGRAMDALHTSLEASARVEGRRRHAGLSFSSGQADERALEALKAIDQFFSGQDLAA